MNAKPAPVADATDLARIWAAELMSAVRRNRLNPAELRLLYENASIVPGSNGLHRAMAQLEYGLWLVALVHYRSEADLRSKLSEACMLLRTEISRRNYYDRLDRVHYFIAGFNAAEQGRPT